MLGEINETIRQVVYHKLYGQDPVVNKEVFEGGKRVGVICPRCKDLYYDGQFYLAEEMLRKCRICKKYYCNKCIEESTFFEIDVCKGCWR